MSFFPWLRPKPVQDAVRSRKEWEIAVETATRLRATVPPRAANDARKFLDLDPWLDVNVRRAEKLGLAKTKGLKILDLGSGSGLFLFICDTLGHQAIGVDLPPETLVSPEREIYTALTAVFGAPILYTGISAFEPLAVGGKLDLIVSFMVCFNNHKRAGEWRRKEWEYFVADMRSHLNPGGRLALRLNHNEAKFGLGGYLDRETTDFFASCGTIDDGKIMIDASA